jgi:DNA modification methylase/DNA-binding transcriptional regulator YiaG
MVFEVMENIKKIKVSDVVFREDLYPRIKIDPTLVQKYADDLEVLPPIEINQANILIDGYHRLTAHKKLEKEEIEVIVTETKSDDEIFELAIERNAKFGLQMNNEDKRKATVKLYRDGTGLQKDRIASLLSISVKTVKRHLENIDARLEKEQDEKIMAMYLASYTQEDIAKEVNMPQKTVDDHLKVLANIDKCPKSLKLSAQFQDPDFNPPLYNLWSYGKLTNETNHPGNSEQRILENLLYLYTNPFDIVFDPFAGGGSTIDVCKKRLRRYWVSDRKPIVEREKEIRKLDIVQELPAFAKRWSEVSLAYLDPPYWKQVEGKYSNDPEDLANMSLEDFTNKLSGVINKIGEKQSHGVIAMLMQPTQWNAPEKKYTDHVFDICNKVKLPVKYRVSIPYSTEQYTPQMVNWAKENKELLVITRELVIWDVKK